MLRSIKELLNYTIRAKDGDFGRVSDFYFDDDMWTVRYLVVDTGTWLPGRQLLISRLVLRQPDWEAHVFPVDLTKEQVESSPDIDLAKPVSRQHEVALSAHYRWPLHWSVPGGVYYLPASPTLIAEAVGSGEEETDEVSTTEGNQDDPHLRSINEVSGYHIEAQDGEIGHVEDFIVDDEVWTIRYMVVDTRNLWPGKKVLVAPPWIEEINWNLGQVQVDLPRENIKNSPEFDPSAPINRAFELRLYDYYGRPKYWL